MSYWFMRSVQVAPPVPPLSDELLQATPVTIRPARLARKAMRRLSVVISFGMIATGAPGAPGGWMRRGRGLKGPRLFKNLRPAIGRESGSRRISGHGGGRQRRA